MKTFTTSLFTAALASSVVSGHAFFQEVYVNGVSAGHNIGIRQAPNNNPVEDVTSPNMICNVSPTSPKDIIPVKAGDTLTAEWHHGLNGADPNDGDDPIAASHKGPIMGYLAKVDSALTTDVASLKWFKFFEDGYDSATKTWAVDKMIAADGKMDMKLPSCLPDGEYLFRAELLALHSAGGYPGAQFYMECAQISVTGGSGSLPTNTVSIPGLYAGTDPGIKISIYNDFGEYQIPGPEVFSCGADTGNTTIPDVPVASSSAAVPVATSSAAPVASSSAAPVVPAPSTFATSASAVPTTTATIPTPTATSAPVTTPAPTDEEEIPDCDDEEEEPVATPTPTVVARAAAAPPAMVRRAPNGHRAYHFHA